jgi:hypothetical protein
MTVYRIGGEAETFDLVSGHAYVTSVDGAHHNANLSRGAMAITTGVSELELPVGTNVDDLYIHFVLYQESVTLNNYIDIKNAAGTETEYRVRMNADGTWTIQRYNGATFDDLGTTSSVMAINAKIDVDIRIVRHATNGSIDVWKDTVNVLTFSGDTDTPNQMGLVRFIGLAGGSNTMYISEVILADESLLNWKLATLAPTANGTHTSWTGDYTDVDEFAYNANDFIEINSTSQLESFVLSDVNAAYSTYNVKGVVVAGRVSNDSGSAVADGQFLVHTGGVDFTSPNLGITKDGSEQSKQYIWATNPDTSNPWTISEVNALESGIKSV